jgi:DnaJ-class molecular chaperone
VREKLDQVRRADYFTILGLPRLCSPHEIREAAARLEGEFDAQRFAGYSEDGLADKLAEIQRVLREAREVLADDQLRAEYIRGLGD